MSGKIRPLSFSTRGCVIVRHIYKAYTCSNNFACWFLRSTCNNRANICNPFIPDKRRNMEGRGKREGTRERIKTSSNKTITIGIGTQFPFTFSYNPNVQPNTMNRYKSCYYNLSDTQFAVFNSSTKQKNYGTRKEGWIFRSLALQTSAAAPLFV